MGEKSTPNYSCYDYYEIQNLQIRILNFGMIVVFSRIIFCHVRVCLIVPWQLDIILPK